MNPADAAGIALNAVGFCAAGAYLYFNADQHARDPVRARLSFAFALLMGLIFVRAVRWSVDVEWLRRIEEMIAAGIPIMALVCAEGLLRRHAPGWLKRIFVLVGVAFAIMAIVRPNGLAGPFAIALGGYVALSFLAIAGLLLTRDRHSLAPNENNAISALALGMVLALPFIATDFLYAADYIPLRCGGLGLIVFVFAAARLGASGQGATAILKDLAWALGAAGAAFSTFVLAFGWPGATFAAAWFLITLALTLLVIIVQGMREQRAWENRQTLMRGLIEAPTHALIPFVEHVQAHGALGRIQVVNETDVRDFDPVMLQDHFAFSPITAARDLHAQDQTSQRLRLMLETFSATHALLAKRAPLTLLLINAPSTGAAPEQTLNLELLQKLAFSSAKDGA